MSDQPRRPTIKDIARALGLSHSTVSRALNGHASISAQTVRDVKRVAGELGYILNASARSIRGDGQVWLGLIVPEISNDFYGSAAAQFAARCRSANARVLLAVSDDDAATERGEIQAMLESRVSGIVIAMSATPLPESLTMLETVPSVQLVRHHRALSSPVARLTDRAGCAAAVEHLIERGHSRIAYLGTDQSTTSGFNRIRGFLDAHTARGLEPLDGGIELVFAGQQQGYDGVGRLLSLGKRPTAIIMGTTRLALGGMRALRDAGLTVPSDMSVIAYGDEPWFDLHTPPLTAVVLPLEQLIDSAMELLETQLRGATVRAPIADIATHLVVRGSTAAPSPTPD